MIGYIILGLASVYVLIWFVRGGWRPFAWLLLKAVGGTIYLFRDLCGLLFCFYVLMAVLGQGRPFFISALIVTAAILILIPSVIERLKRTKGLVGELAQIAFEDEEEAVTRRLGRREGTR
jgi:hypothetical protein